MRPFELPTSLLSLLTVLATTSAPVNALSIPFADELSNLGELSLGKRCANPCGYYQQVCCNTGETCYTNSAGQAACAAAGSNTGNNNAAQGQWQYYTITYTRTDLQTVTMTTSSYIGAVTVTTTAQCNSCNQPQCSYSNGQTPCGSNCCAQGQICLASGQCAAGGGGSSANSFYTPPNSPTPSSQTASNNIRPTSNTVLTVTQTGSFTTGFLAPVSTDGSVLIAQNNSGGGGLSGGAIAGIVLGVIFGIILLILICACCCLKGLADGILSIFGLGPKRRRTVEETTYVEERHSHRNSNAGGRTWYGASKPSRPARDEKKSGLGGLAGVTAGLGGLALLLGLKRSSERRHDGSSVSHGSSYYSDYTKSSK